MGIHHWASPKRVPKTAAPIPCSTSKAINGGLIPVPAASPKADPKTTAPAANWAASVLNSGHRGLGIPDPAVGALVEQQGPPTVGVFDTIDAAEDDQVIAAFESIEACAF